MAGKLSASQQNKIRRLSAPAAASPDLEGGELNVVPFLDILMNVLMFVLATLAVTFTATIDTAPPRPSPRSSVAPAALGLTVLIVRDGFSIKASGGNVGAGCQALGSGLAVRGRDYAALRACVTKLKSQSEAFAGEGSVTLSASPDIPYETVIGVMDALRAADDGSELFPDVALAVVD